MNEVIFQIEEGVIVMLIGMGVVFIFLAILVYAMGIMSKFIQKFNLLYPEPVEEERKSAKSSAANENEAVAVAIAAVMARG